MEYYKRITNYLPKLIVFDLAIPVRSSSSPLQIIRVNTLLNWVFAPAASWISFSSKDIEEKKLN